MIITNAKTPELSQDVVVRDVSRNTTTPVTPPEVAPPEEPETSPDSAPFAPPDEEKEEALPCVDPDEGFDTCSLPSWSRF